MQRKSTAADQNAILVTGGSGYIGKNLVQKLASEDLTVVSMYRHHLPEPSAFVYPVCSDMSSAELIAAPLRGVETVIHLAWSPGFTGQLPKKKKRFEHGDQPATENLRSLANLIKAMENTGTKRIILVSALGAKRGVSNHFLQEKYLAEFAVLNSKIPEKVIVRPSLVYTGDVKNDRLIRSISHLFDFPGVYPVPNAKALLSPIYIENLSSILLALATKPLPEPAAILEIDGGDAMKTEDFFRLVGMYAGKKKKIALRGRIANHMLPIFERYGAVSKDSGNDSPSLRAMLELSRPSTLKNQEQLGFAPFWPEKFQTIDGVFAERAGSSIK